MRDAAARADCVYQLGEAVRRSHYPQSVKYARLQAQRAARSERAKQISRGLDVRNLSIQATH